MRRERERAAQQAAGGSDDLPFGVYLLFSSFTAIAAVSSWGLSVSAAELGSAWQGHGCGRPAERRSRPWCRMLPGRPSASPTFCCTYSLLPNHSLALLLAHLRIDPIFEVASQHFHVPTLFALESPLT